MADPHAKDDVNGVSASARSRMNEKPGILHAFKTVAWSFLGIRKNSEFQRDLRSVNPLHVILVGFVLALVFVAVLVLIVMMVAT